tara:strand:+ start:77 stop:373 length:297 start_codon:yes stop_codon:yes gene_type:complete
MKKLKQLGGTSCKVHCNNIESPVTKAAPVGEKIEDTTSCKVHCNNIESPVRDEAPVTKAAPVKEKIEDTTVQTIMIIFCLILIGGIFAGTGTVMSMVY